jgi:soluble lytic murein transglycosylase-like protein
VTLARNRVKQIAFLLALCQPALACAATSIPANALKYRADLTREAHFVFGLAAPVDYLAGQIEQESGWRPGITAWDNGRGLAQFMDGTAAWVSQYYPEVGKPQPYNPLWAIRAMVRLDAYNAKRVAAVTDCDRWGAALKGYNAGVGYVLRAQRRAEIPGLWFGKYAAEQINAGQSKENFTYSRLYPRRIIFAHAYKYRAWGQTTFCTGRA